MKIEIPEQKTLVHEMVIPIRWGDMDAMGHVNNTSYFRYMETIRIDWMVAAGFPPDPTGEGPVIVNAFCNFYKGCSEKPATKRATWLTVFRSVKFRVIRRCFGLNSHPTCPV